MFVRQTKQFKKWKKILNDTELNHLYTELLYHLDIWNEYYKNKVLSNIDNVWLLVFSNKELKKINYKSNEHKEFYSKTKLPALGGYILLYPTIRNAKYDFIDVCDTVFANLQLLQCMITHIEKYKKKLLPLNIIKSSTGYWKKYLKRNYQLETNIETFLNTLERPCDWSAITNEC